MPAGGEVPSTVQEAVRSLHSEIRAAARSTVRAAASGDSLSYAPVQGEGDVSYSIDLEAEGIIDRFFRTRWHAGPVTVVCEGMGSRTYPDGAADSEVQYRVIVDPLDGTRELMYDKRSAWILTGVATNRGVETNLSDILYAVQTEVPVSRQGKGLVLQAFKGSGATQELWSLDEEPRFLGYKPLQPSRAPDLWNGTAVFVDFFAPGPRLAIARLSDRILEALVPPGGKNQALVFNDQYLSNAGQLYLVASGAYRFVADLRPLLQPETEGGTRRGICSHPYDLCTALIASEAGAIVTGGDDRPLSYPLDTSTDCVWVAYSNEAIRALLEGPLREALGEMLG